MNVSKVAKAGLLYTQTGTPFFASPEVWSDQAYNNKCDVWSLGCVLYETMSLQLPFKDENMSELFKSIAIARYPDLPNIYSYDLKRLVKSMITV